jgi:hypothetical protein
MMGLYERECLWCVLSIAGHGNASHVSLVSVEAGASSSATCNTTHRCLQQM